MYDTGAVGHGNVLVAGNEKSLFMLLFGTQRRTLVERFKFFVFQVFSGIALHHLIGRRVSIRKIGKHAVAKCLCQIVGIAVLCLYLYVGLMGIYAKCHV